MLLSAGVPERNARSMLGRLRKDHGDEAVLAAIERCADVKAAQPVEFLLGCLRSTKKPVAVAGETPYQRTMRERMNAAVPGIAAKPPSLHPQPLTIDMEVGNAAAIGMG
jgi:hypothetical protein